MLAKSLTGYKWLPFAIGAFVIASGYLAYRIDTKAYERGRSEVQAAWDAEKLSQLQSYAELQARYIEITRQLKQDANALGEDLREKLHDTEENYQAIVADLRSGNLRLRQQWQSCAASMPSATDPPGPPGGDDGSSPQGLPAAPIERVLRLGLEADQVAARLESCQRYVQTIRF